MNLKKLILIPFIILTIKYTYPAYKQNVKLNDRLIQACFDQSIKRIRKLIHYGANVNSQDIDGDTALIALLSLPRNKKTVKISKLLINSGADVNKQNSDGFTAIMIILNSDYCQEDEEITRLLIDSGANLIIRENSGNTALMISAIKDNSKLSFLLINSDTGIINIRNIFGLTALMASCGNRNIELTNIFIKSNADLNIVNDFGQTALTISILNTLKEKPNSDNYLNDLIIIKLLLENGALITSNDISLALYINHTEIIDLLKSYGAQIGCKEKLVSISIGLAIKFNKLKEYFFNEDDEL